MKRQRVINIILFIGVLVAIGCSLIFVNKPVEVDAVFSVPVAERKLHNVPAVVPYNIKKHVIHRCHDKHVLGRSGQLPDTAGNYRDNSGAENKLALFVLDPVSFLPPVDICAVPFIGNSRIPENPVPGTLYYRFCDLWRSPEVHIRHPHRQLSLANIPLKRIRPRPVDDLIKIVSHNAPLSHCHFFYEFIIISCAYYNTFIRFFQHYNIYL